MQLTMKDVMTANCQISNEVMLTSNHCAALARELNAMLAAAPDAVGDPEVVAVIGETGHASPEPEWTYCPECGCEDVRHEEGEHKQCASCHQEWFSSVDYSDVVRKHLSGKYIDKDAQIERLRAELGECKGEYDRAVNKVDALREQLADASYFVRKMCDAAGNQPSVATGYLHDILDVIRGSASAETDTTAYRLLAAGDTIASTDEYLEDDAATWSPVRPGIFSGMKYIRGAMVPVRRATTSAEPSKARAIPVEISALFLELSKGQSPEEVRRNQAIAMGIKIEPANKESSQ